MFNANDQLHGTSMWQKFSRRSASSSRLYWSDNLRAHCSLLNYQYGSGIATLVLAISESSPVLNSGIRVASFGLSRLEGVRALAALNSEVVNPQEIPCNHQLSSKSPSRNQQSQFVAQAHRAANHHRLITSPVQTRAHRPSAYRLTPQTSPWQAEKTTLLSSNISWDSVNHLSGSSSRKPLHRRSNINHLASSSALREL